MNALGSILFQVRKSFSLQHVYEVEMWSGNGLANNGSRAILSLLKARAHGSEMLTLQHNAGGNGAVIS